MIDKIKKRIMKNREEQARQLKRWCNDMDCSECSFFVSNGKAAECKIKCPCDWWDI